MLAGGQRLLRQREMGIVGGRNYDQIEGRIGEQRLRIAHHRHRWPVGVHFAGIAAGDGGQLQPRRTGNQRRMKGFAGVAVTDQPDTNFLSHGISSCWLTTDPFDLTPCGRMEQEVNEMLILSGAGVAKRAARRRDAELSG